MLRDREIQERRERQKNPTTGQREGARHSDQEVIYLHWPQRP